MNYAIVVAGGSGKRMNSDTPKQFLLLRGKPILYYTLSSFLSFDPDLKIILVTPKDSSEAKQLLHTFFRDESRIQRVDGGETRFHSVQNGLQVIQEDGIVFIHDGVRPFITKQLLQTCLQQAVQSGNAIPCVPLKDSIRLVSESGNRAVTRTDYRSIQTPQTFRIKEIQQAFEQEYLPIFTDEASVFEAAGHSICLVEGDESNIKITTPQDMDLAVSILQTRV
jgi:2-C-methyl-D-erythritol 4-phosphate cytidylyltransferase